MRIGIDARFLTHPQPGGFKTYTTNLIYALTEVDNVNEYVLYLDRPPINTSLPDHPHFRYVVVPQHLPSLGMPLREQLGLKQQIAKDKLDLVHFLCNTAPVGINTKYIITLHDTIQVADNTPFRLRRSLDEQKHWAITKYSKWSILKTVKRAQRIITVSNFEKNNICRDMGLDSSMVEVTHLAASSLFSPAKPETKNLWRTQIRSSLGIAKKFMLGVGFEARKNIPLLIESFSLLARQHLEVDLVIVAADEAARHQFQQLCEDFLPRNRFHVLGRQQPQDLLKLYNLAEVFVFPSERESFGLPPLEALSCGTATIAMNQSSIPEIMMDGALLLDGKDPQVWANAIRQVITNCDLRTKLSLRGQLRASQLTWQNCAQKTVAIYESLLSQENHSLQMRPSTVSP